MSVRASSVGRLLQCPGSLALSEGIETTESEYAAEGTLAHEVLETALLLDLPAAEVCDDLEMADLVQQAVDYISNVRNSNELIEHRIDGEICGTVDYAVCYIDGGTVLEIVDLKYGAGVPVSPIWNPQLMTYAGLLESRYSPERIRLTIIQPRIGGIESWDTSVLTVRQHMAGIRQALERDELCVGEYCRWCPAREICPEIEKQTLSVAQEQFEISTTSDERLAEIFLATGAIKKRLESIPGLILQRMKEGVEFPGLKAVQARGNRKWIFDEERTLAELKSARIPKTKSTVAKLVSPTQLEKTLKGDERFSHLVTRPDKGLTVVPLNDRRPAVSLLTAIEEFNDDTENTEGTSTLPESVSQE